jgi:hypothetical protein
VESSGQKQLALASASKTPMSKLKPDLIPALTLKNQSSNDRFNITVQYGKDVSEYVKNMVRRAVRRIEQIIIKDMPDFVWKPEFGLPCSGLKNKEDFEVPSEIEDFWLSVEFDYTKPLNNNLASGGVCRLTPDRTRILSGWVEIDPKNIFLATVKIQEMVLIHEIIHALGFDKNSLNSRGLVSLEDPNRASGTCDKNPRYIGKSAVKIWKNKFGGVQESIPLDNSNVIGTCESHWRRAAISNEIMRPNISDQMFLSSLTIGVLEDLGYGVDYSTAEDSQVVVQPGS